MLDVYMTVDGGICPEGPVQTIRRDSEKTNIGGAFNVVRTLKQMEDTSAQVAFLTAWPETLQYPFELPRASWMPRVQMDDGLVASHVPLCEIVTKTRLVDPTGKTVLRLDSPRHVLSDPRAQSILNALRRVLNDTRWDAIIISDYDMGVISDEVISVIMTEAHAASIFVDTKRLDLRPFQGAFAVKLNTIEHDRQLIQPYQAPELFQNYIITKARYGAELHRLERLSQSTYRTDVEKFEAPPVTAIDVVGCGDLFLAALVHANVILGCDIRRAIRFATFVATAKSTYHGCAPPAASWKEFNRYEKVRNV